MRLGMVTVANQLGAVAILLLCVLVQEFWKRVWRMR